jgi:hypothetical protein
MALYNLQNHELVTYFAISHVSNCNRSVLTHCSPVPVHVP